MTDIIELCQTPQSTQELMEKSNRSRTELSFLLRYLVDQNQLQKLNKKNESTGGRKKVYFFAGPIVPDEFVAVGVKHD